MSKHDLVFFLFEQHNLSQTVIQLISLQIVSETAPIEGPCDTSTSSIMSRIAEEVDESRRVNGMKVDLTF